MSESDWPFFEAPPPGRVELQHQLVANDPFFRLLGLRLHEIEQDRVTLALAFRSDLAQPTGILHGGLHAVLIDSAIAQAFLTTIRPAFSVVTVHMDTKYLGPVREGQVFATARVVRKGKRIAHGEAVVCNDAGTAVAQGWGVFAVTGSGSL